MIVFAKAKAVARRKIMAINTWIKIKSQFLKRSIMAP
jgi:hypothetical protein